MPLPRSTTAGAAAHLVVRAKFNPNLTFSVVHRRDAYGQRHHFARNVPARRGVIREREHGTLEHLLAMPLRPSEIMLAKAWANGLVIVAAGDVVTNICREMATSRADCRFGGALCGRLVIYLFSVTSLGILIATLVGSMPQFGLLALPIFIMMNFLSGGTTPMESMPEILQPSNAALTDDPFCQLRPGRPLSWRGFRCCLADCSVIAVLGLVFFGVALVRFRRMVAQMQT